MEISADDLYKYIDEFTNIYENGKTVNPIPDNVKVTVWCEGTHEEGFACNVTKNQLGVKWLIAKKWIAQSKLEKLLQSDEITVK